MSLVKRERAVEIFAGSGMLRVTINPRPAWLAVLVEVFTIALVSSWFVRGWASLALFHKVFFSWVSVSTFIALLCQFSGFEVIEIDSRKLVIEKQIAGWTRRREYSIDDCRDLEWKEGGEDQPHRLQCKVGWRTIKFGISLSEEEGIEVITALQTSLPEVAHQMLKTSAEMKKHFTTLNLS